MAKGIDLSGLKNEIENRKSERNTSVGITEQGSPKDIFLNGLLTSLKTGRSTPATKLLESLENTIPDSMNIAPIAENNHRPRNMGVANPVDNFRGISPERDDKLFEQFNRSNKKTLAESLEEYAPNSGQNFGNRQQVNEVAMKNVDSLVTEALAKNLDLLLEDAIKTTIIEMYSAERIKQVINENKGMIKTIVMGVIDELRQKNKK